MDLTDFIIITCYTCPSNRFWQKPVAGSKGDTHIVTYAEHTGWHCSCDGFKFRSNCKHIHAVEKDRCGWNWEAYCGTVGTPTEDKKCPSCGEPVESIRVGV